MPDPLPELGAADLGGGGVLHQIVERHATGAVQPCLDVADPDIEVLPEPGFGDRSVGDGEKIGCSGVHVLALAGDLVGLRHLPVEDLLSNRDQARMRHPSAVVPVAGLAQLVGADLLHRRFVGRGVVADRDLRRHAAHRVDLAAVAGLISNRL